MKKWVHPLTAWGDHLNPLAPGVYMNVLYGVDNNTICIQNLSGLSWYNNPTRTQLLLA